MDVRGRWPQQLTFGESVTFHQWSPTGEWIIYGTDRGGNEREGYYLITPDGKIERELLPASEAFRVFGGFSRDGKKITYATTERNGCCGLRQVISVIVSFGQLCKLRVIWSKLQIVSSFCLILALKLDTSIP